MSTNQELKPGLSGEVEVVVSPKHTAPHVGSGKVAVLATPVMVNLMEAASLAAVESLLPAGSQTVGTQLNVGHYAATPVGMRVSARAELIAVDGRKLTFRVEARDERELIGDGTHERLIISLARFDRRMEEKAASIGRP